MKRHNMVQQFVGEPDPASDGTSAEGVGYDEVELQIVRGKVSLVVPANTPDDEVWNNPRVCLLDVETEDGQTFQFEVTNDGDGNTI
ncbi:MAG: hypothetical protein KY468_03315 [Armatimonadetes bacterium]|nr:hypothetical protein [Armatimonadota bacterium]